MTSYPPIALGQPRRRRANASDYRLRLHSVSLASPVGLIIPASATHNTFNPTRLTVRMRVNIAGGVVNNGLISRTSLSNAQGDWALGFFNGSSMAPTFRVNNNGAGVQSPTALSVGVWYFIEGNYDSSLATNNLKIFVDGVLKAQANYTTAITNNPTFPIYPLFYFSSSNGTQAAISEFEVCANKIRNDAAYTPPTAIIPDVYSTVFFKAMVSP